MKQTFARKPLAILLSLLMVLSVFGGMAFTASAGESSVEIDSKVFAKYDISYEGTGSGENGVQNGVTIGLVGKTLAGDGKSCTLVAGEAVKLAFGGTFTAAPALFGDQFPTFSVSEYTDIIADGRFGALNIYANESMIGGEEGQIPVSVEKRDDGLYLVANYPTSDVACINAGASVDMMNSFSTNTLRITVIPAVAKIGDAFYASLQDALNAAEAGATITLLDDLTLNAYIPVTKSLTLDGDGHTVTTTATRGLRVSESGVDVTVKNLTLVPGAATERAIQVDSDKDNVNLTIDNVTASATYYTVNICGGVDDLHLVINNSTITGWAAINLYGSGLNVDINDSTLTGINDKGYNAEGWNNFGTVVLEGDTTGQTTDHSSDYVVTISNSTIAASSTTGNKQYAILHNWQSVNNKVILVGCTVTLGENCEFFLDNSYNSVSQIKDTTVNGAPYAPTAEDDGYVVAEVNGYKQIVDADEFLPIVGDTYYASFEEAVEAAGDNDLTVQAPANTEVSVAFTPAAAAAIADNAGESNVYLYVDDVTTAEEAAANAKTFEITMVDDNGDPVFDEAAAAGFAKVTVPFVKFGDGPIVVNLVVSGVKTAVPCTYANGFVTFTVEHFSIYTVEQLADSVAVIESALGNKYFASLADAVDEVANGETIKLLADDTTGVTINNNKTFTIDLNGQTLNDNVIIQNAVVTVIDSAKFLNYKTTAVAQVTALAAAGDNEAASQIIANAIAAINALPYDTTKTPDENIAAIKAIETQTANDLETIRRNSAIEQFNAYKAEMKAYIKANKPAGDSKSIAKIIDEANSAIDAIAYDDSKTLEENKAAVTVIADSVSATFEAGVCAHCGQYHGTNKLATIICRLVDFVKTMIIKIIPGAKNLIK